MTQATGMKRIIAAKALEGHRLHLRFDDGIEGVADLANLSGRGVFVAWDDTEHFARVRVTEHGAVEWEGGIDLCPDELYMRVTGAKLGELFPDWRMEAVHA